MFCLTLRLSRPGPIPGRFLVSTAYDGTPCYLGTPTSSDPKTPCSSVFTNTATAPLVATYTLSRGIFGLAASLNGSIAVALSVIPLASPASGVITKIDPATGAELPSSISLGPIFTERAETIGRHKFYIGVSNQDFHFATLNGKSLSPTTMLQPAVGLTNVYYQGTQLTTLPATINVAMDVRLSQNVTFLTYGVTNRIDVSVGLPVVHAGVSSATTNGVSYAANGVSPAIGACWCVGTFTPGVPPGSNAAWLDGSADWVCRKVTKTGFGDMLLRFKGNVFEGRI